MSVLLAEGNRSRRGTWAISLAGHRVVVTEVFWSYWYLAAERQRVFFRRILGLPGPWTHDSVISQYRFTNAYRSADRVSQYLLQQVIYDRDRDAVDTILRVLLFKVFNRIETWEWLVSHVGEPDALSFDAGVYTRVLDERFNSGGRLYSAAYVMPAPSLGHVRKHENHLNLLANLLATGVLVSLTRAVSLEQLYYRLLGIQSFGPFLAYQYAIDLNYSPVFDFDEMDFVVPGPGALRGIDKCFEDTGGLGPDEIVACMAASADEFLAFESVPFLNLFGRPLHLVDCQNLFCEVDKYARVLHPTRSRRGPSRIKQGFRADRRPLPLGFPPKWGLPWTADAPKIAAELTRDVLRDVWKPLSSIRGVTRTG
ncbi:MAG: putative DNA base hypermodification protein [bacterium]|nr:putative DNA base hypermodification protein [bacterium]